MEILDFGNLSNFSRPPSLIFNFGKLTRPPSLYYYICKRIDRSYEKISEFKCTIDEISLKKKTPINLKIIKEILGVSN